MGAQPPEQQPEQEPQHQPEKKTQRQTENKLRFSLPPPRRWAIMAAAAGAGIGSGLLGTSLHGHAWFLNDGQTILPFGAALALLLLVSVGLFVGLWSKSSWIVVLCGAAAYVTAGVLSLQLGSVGIITGNLQGNVWLYGIAIATPLTAWLVNILLKSRK
ncbi:hypothetical protein AS189_06195 [Arthrobacter alpinus]|uniref:Uncharacterized protein n=1 Tax=Arthrobacter alpinus TaxID=656366 RepID=A0A0S2LXM6_9MICC|nr:hypothetical protein [Arthrobacter alpinus]ALO66159.1 hypothetical protein AS189_06195 [Arthrobacter alpinus]